MTSSMQCKHDENMMIPCQHHSNVKQTMMMWCSWNANNYDLIPIWHEWNVNADDVMMTWFAFFVNLVTSHLACMLQVHEHGAHVLYKYGTSKYPSGLVFMLADSNLLKLTEV